MTPLKELPTFATSSEATGQVVTVLGSCVRTDLMSDGELSLSPLSEFPNLGVITDIRPEPSPCCDRWSNTSQPKH